MRFSTVLAAAFAATAIAAPAVRVVDTVHVVDVTVTAGTPQATAAAKKAAAAKHPSDPSTTPPAFLESTPTPSPTASSGPTDGSGSGAAGNQGILDTYNKWRSAYGLPSLQWSDKLTNNAVQTGQMNGGTREEHHLDSGVAEGQIITPGKPETDDYEGCNGFDLAMISWLCEVPSDQELQSASIDGKGVCDIVGDYGMKYSETGHHDIIVNPDYKYLGCAFTPSGHDGQYNGIWVCTVSPDA